MRTVLVALMFLGVLLAGCADSAPADPDPGFVDPGTAELAKGKGAIAGLLVDDRFRPIPDGTILLQETGEQRTTNENGEFQFLDLEPGQFTLRANAEGHEAKPTQVTVEEGVFADASVIARRVLSTDGVILTQEYAVFAYCAINVLLPLSDACSALDVSGDSSRIYLNVDYSSVAGELTVLVTEFLADNPGDFYILMGHGLDGLSAQYYMNEVVNGDYTKCINTVGELYEPCLDTNLGAPFSVNESIEYIVYINGMLDDEINNVLFGLPLTGVGVSLAVKARFMLSAFLGEPEEDLDTYCLLC